MRAALDRERATRDRELASADRELAARDRDQAKQDRDQAGTDELTGARRRGVGLEELQRDIDRAKRTGDSLVAAYIDVDGLKATNDEHGHSAGDQLLRDVAEGLRDRMRSYDLLVRLGGDEFLCVLQGITVDEARRRLEDLRTELSQGPMPKSFGVGLSELRDGEKFRELIDRADQDLLANRTR
jgi:diguanylate cyclase (GGDEF)-like protein